MILASAKDQARRIFRQHITGAVVSRDSYMKTRREIEALLRSVYSDFEEQREREAANALRVKYL